MTINMAVFIGIFNKNNNIWEDHKKHLTNEKKKKNV